MLHTYQGVGIEGLVRILTKDKQILAFLKQIEKTGVHFAALGNNDCAVDVVISGALEFSKAMKSLLPRIKTHYSHLRIFVLKKTLRLHGGTHNIFILFDKPKKEAFDLYKNYISFVISFLFESESFFCVHGSSIATDLGGILITGKTGSGKSTLLSNLAASGYSGLTDSYSLIYKQCSKARMLSTSQLLDTFGLQEVDYSVFGDFNNDRQSWDFAADKPFEAKGYEVKILLFPEIARNKKSSMRTLTKTEALQRLIAFSSASLHGDNAEIKKRHLDLLRDLSWQCDSYHFLSGRDIIDDAHFRSYDILKKALLAGQAKEAVATRRKHAYRKYATDSSGINRQN